MSLLFGVLLAAVPALCVVVCFWIKVRFFRHVYDKGGAQDLKAAADALRKRDLPEELSPADEP